MDFVVNLDPFHTSIPCSCQTSTVSTIHAQYLAVNQPRMARFYCCCCSSHLGAAKVIGILWTVSDILFISLLILSMVYASIENNHVGVSRSLWDMMVGSALLTIGIYAAFLLVDVGLIYGSYQKIGCLLTTWAIVTGIRSILTLIFTIVVLQHVIPVTIGLVMVVVVSLIVNIWAILTVTSAAREIKKENEEKRNAVVPFA